MSLGKTNLTTLAAIHSQYPCISPSRDFMPRQCLQDAQDEIVSSRYAIEQKDKQIAKAASIIEGMETRSKKLQEELDRALEMLHGKPETTPTVAAGSLMRGVEQLPEG